MFYSIESTRVTNSTKDKPVKISTMFYTKQEAYDFYNAYARSHNMKNSTAKKMSGVGLKEYM
jgi:hypothetical protein